MELTQELEQELAPTLTPTQKLALEREREQPEQPELTQEPQELYDADGKLPLLLF